MSKPEYRTTEDEITFNILNENVVKRLQQQGEVKLPQKKVDVPRDMRWNLKTLNSMLLQGIQNGDSVKKIAASIFPEVNAHGGIVAKNQQSAIRSARTMTTEAENRGRLDSYDNLADQGVVQKKVWIATPDDRTRESHLEIDGEEVDIDEPFSNGLMYPADPDGDPAEVWNCRCSMRTHIVGVRKADGHVESIGTEREQTMHNEQIAEEREHRGVEPEEASAEKTPVDMGDTINKYTDDQKEQIKQLLGDNTSAAKDIYLENVDRLKEPVDINGRSFYRPYEKQVYLDVKDTAKGSNYQTPYETHFHEYGHNIDDINGRISTTYRDANGRSFEEIITSEWDARLVEQGTLLNFDKADDPSAWADKALTKWRKENGLTTKDAQYLALKKELGEQTEKSEIRNFIKNNIDIFSDVKYNKNASLIFDFCEEVKGKYSLIDRANLSDMFERYSLKHGGDAYPFGVGHGRKYANIDGSLAKETFAEMFASEISNKGSLEAIKEYLPQSYAAFTDMLGRISK